MKIRFYGSNLKLKKVICNAIAGGGIRSPEYMKEALYMKQEHNIIHGWEDIRTLSCPE